MRQNVPKLLALGCLVVLAGCTGALSGDSGTDSPTLEDVSYPAGVSENGTNVSALADAHSETLDGSNFTLALDMEQNGSTGDQAVSMHAAVGADRDRIRANVSGTDRQMATYLTETKRYVRVTSDSEPKYRASERAPNGAKLVPSSYAGSTYVDQYAANVNANFTPTGVRVVDGRPLLVLESDGSNVSAPGANVTAYDATLLVDERGVVHRFEVTAQSESGDNEQQFSLVMTISDVGETTVERPQWLDEARNRTSS